MCMYDEWALVHFRTLVTLRRVRVGLELRLRLVRVRIRVRIKPMADGPSFSYEKLVRETWYKKLVRVS